MISKALSRLQALPLPVRSQPAPSTLCLPLCSTSSNPYRPYQLTIYSESSVLEIRCFQCTRSARQVLEQSDKVTIKVFIERNLAVSLDKIHQYLLNTDDMWASTPTTSQGLTTEITNKAERDRHMWVTQGGPAILGAKRSGTRFFLARLSQKLCKTL